MLFKEELEQKLNEVSEHLNEVEQQTNKLYERLYVMRALRD